MIRVRSITEGGAILLIDASNRRAGSADRGRDAGGPELHQHAKPEPAGRSRRLRPRRQRARELHEVSRRARRRGGQEPASGGRIHIYDALERASELAKARRSSPRHRRAALRWHGRRLGRREPRGGARGARRRQHPGDLCRAQVEAVRPEVTPRDRPAHRRHVRRERYAEPSSHRSSVRSAPGCPASTRSRTHRCYPRRPRRS